MNKCPGLCWPTPGHLLEKKLGGFSYIFQNYGKVWSISLGNFIKDKPLISEEYSETVESFLAWGRGLFTFSCWDLLSLDELKVSPKMEKIENETS